jgi:hypothetical protein
MFFECGFLIVEVPYFVRRVCAPQMRDFDSEIDGIESDVNMMII